VSESTDADDDAFGPTSTTHCFLGAMRSKTSRSERHTTSVTAVDTCTMMTPSMGAQSSNSIVRFGVWFVLIAAYVFFEASSRTTAVIPSNGHTDDPASSALIVVFWGPWRRKSLFDPWPTGARVVREGPLVAPPLHDDATILAIPKRPTTLFSRKVQIESGKNDPTFEASTPDTPWSCIWCVASWPSIHAMSAGVLFESEDNAPPIRCICWSTVRLNWYC
jgi:hypothetical protein